MYHTNMAWESKANAHAVHSHTQAGKQMAEGYLRPCRPVTTANATDHAALEACRTLLDLLEGKSVRQALVTNKIQSLLVVRRDGTGAPDGFEYCRDMINDRNVVVGSVTGCPSTCACVQASAKRAQEPDVTAGHICDQTADSGKSQCIYKRVHAWCIDVRMHFVSHMAMEHEEPLALSPNDSVFCLSGSCYHVTCHHKQHVTRCTWP
jgi:hypothetical protein